MQPSRGSRQRDVGNPRTRRLCQSRHVECREDRSVVAVCHPLRVGVGPAVHEAVTKLRRGEEEVELVGIARLLPEVQIGVYVLTVGCFRARAAVEAWFAVSSEWTTDLEPVRGQSLEDGHPALAVPGA